MDKWTELKMFLVMGIARFSQSNDPTKKSAVVAFEGVLEFMDSLEKREVLEESK